MQRIIRNVLAILLFLTAPAYAGGAMGLMMAGSSAAAGCSNNSTTDYVGDKTTRTANASNSANVFTCARYQASNMTCTTGTLGGGTIHHYGTGSANMKVLVYKSTDTTPVTGSAADELIGASSSMAVSADQTYKTADIGGTVTKNDYYWVCQTQDAAASVYKDNAGASVYQAALSFASPPASFSGASFSTIVTRLYEMWVEVK